MPPQKLSSCQRFWRDRFAAVEPGLTLQELQRRFGVTYGTVHRWVVYFGYPITDLRADAPSWVDWTRVDWRQPNAAIARALNVSRERVRQVRLGTGKPKVLDRTSSRSQVVERLLAG